VPTEVFLPDCLSKIYRFLFPTLDWSRIHFFDGIPFPLNIGPKDGITVPSAFSSAINIYLADGNYVPCGPGAPPRPDEPSSWSSEQYNQAGAAHHTFLLLAHELVHALQIQESAGSGYIPGSWITQYVTCWFASRSTHCGNPIEDEAYDYANGCPNGNPARYGGALRMCVDSAYRKFLGSQGGNGLLAPCDCSAIPPYRETEMGVPPDKITFLELIQNECPLIPKQHSSATVGIMSCVAKACADLPLLGCIWGFASLGLGLIAGIVGAILGGLFGTAFKGLFGSIGNFFTGGGAHSLNLLFSRDDAKGFGNKATLVGSSEPPAVAFGPTGTITAPIALFLAWTDSDDHLEILRTPPPTRTRFWEANSDCGPGIATAFSQLFMAWQDGDNHVLVSGSPAPHLTPDYIGQAFGPGSHLGDSQDSATPALTFDASGQRLYAAWGDGDGNIFIASSADGSVWTRAFYTRETMVGDGTPALAFGHGKVFLAWTGTDDDNHLNLVALTPTGGGTGFIVAQPKTTLRERSSDDAGPALAFGNDRLFLAWTDDSDRVNVVVSTDDGASFSLPWDGGEHSSDNAGPALAYLESGERGTPGLLCLAWVGTD
jgi:hypothetical protein